MTTFTPPTEFPHECQTINGRKITLLAVDSNGAYACLRNLDTGLTLADIQKPEHLRDLPKVTSMWQNVYPNGGTDEIFLSRKSADHYAVPSRIGVMRIDKTDGVFTCVLEDV